MQPDEPLISNCHFHLRFGLLEFGKTTEKLAYTPS